MSIEINDKMTEELLVKAIEADLYKISDTDRFVKLFESYNSIKSHMEKIEAIHVMDVLFAIAYNGVYVLPKLEKVVLSSTSEDLREKMFSFINRKMKKHDIELVKQYSGLFEIVDKIVYMREYFDKINASLKAKDCKAHVTFDDGTQDMCDVRINHRKSLIKITSEKSGVIEYDYSVGVFLGIRMLDTDVTSIELTDVENGDTILSIKYDIKEDPKEEPLMNINDLAIDNPEEFINAVIKASCKTKEFKCEDCFFNNSCDRKTKI